MTTLASVASIWWWIIGLAVVAVLLIALGRRAGTANIAGQIPRDQGPDVQGAAQRLTADIRPEDQKSSDSTKR